MIFCRHDWRIVGVEPIRRITDFAEHDATRVLLVCEKCSKPKAKIVEGNWTIAQLRGQSQ